MQFNDSNDTGRLVQRVNGRVIVFTTSEGVEFLSTDKKWSFPLWNYDGHYAPDQGLVFVFEGEGFLTFNEMDYTGNSSQVKIEEVGPFVRFDFNPQYFTVVRSLDPYVSRITGLHLEYPSGGICYTALVSFSQADGSTGSVEIQTSVDAYRAVEVWNSTFAVGHRWKGLSKYPGYYQAQV